MLIKQSEFFNGMKLYGDYFEIYKNPTQKELDTFRSGIRGIINFDGTIYIWDGDILHEKAISAGDVPDGIHFEYSKRQGGIGLYLTEGTTPETLCNAFNSAKSNLYFIKDSDLVLYIDTSYYGAEYHPVYNEITKVIDLYNLKDIFKPTSVTSRLLKNIKMLKF